MKKLVSVLMMTLLLAMMLLPLGVAADSVTTMDYLTFTLEGDSYVVTDCVESYTGALEIPAQWEGKPVTAIGATAFFGCQTLTAVTVPAGVTTIGDQAFRGCTSLSEVVLPESVTAIGFDVFHDTAYYNSSNNWRDGVLYVGDCAVASRSDLKDGMMLADGTRLIASDAFYDRQIATVSIPESVTIVCRRAFGACEKLTTVYYGGDKSAWQKVAIADENAALQNAKVQYNTLTERQKVSPWLWVSLGSGAAAIAMAVVMMRNRKTEDKSPANDAETENN